MVSFPMTCMSDESDSDSEGGDDSSSGDDSDSGDSSADDEDLELEVMDPSESASEDASSDEQ